jgi:hypothetical protein
MPARGFKPRHPARFVVVSDRGLKTIGQIDQRGTLVSASSALRPVLPILTPNPSLPIEVGAPTDDEVRKRRVEQMEFPRLAPSESPGPQDGSAIFSLKNLLS